MQQQLSLTPAQMALLPTPEEVEFYETHGWFITPQVLPDAVIDQALLGSERFYRGERDAVLAVAEGYSDWHPGDGDLRNNEFVSLQCWDLRQLILHPMIGAIAACLARTSQTRLLDDQLVYKPPRSPVSAVGWHADRAYWGTCSSERLLTAWIPLHDCDQNRGALVVMDGSHHWPEAAHLRHFNQQNLTDLEQQLTQNGRIVNKVAMTLKKGQLSFHHCWTIHGSYPNQSDQGRWAIAVHLQDRENHYQPCRNQNGQPVHMFDEQLCRKNSRGEPDFSDPAIFPVVWPSPMQVDHEQSNSKY